MNAAQDETCQSRSDSGPLEGGEGGGFPHVRHRAWPDFGRQFRRRFHGNPDRCGHGQNMPWPRRSSSQLAFQLIQSSVVFRQRPCDVIRALHTLHLLGLDHERCDRRELQLASSLNSVRPTCDFTDWQRATLNPSWNRL